MVWRRALGKLGLVAVPLVSAATVSACSDDEATGNDGAAGTSPGGGSGGGSSGGAGGVPSVPTAPPEKADGPEITRFEAVQNPANVLSLYASWTTSAAVPTVLEVDCGEGWRHTYRGATDELGHEVYVMGLWPGADCTLTAEAASSPQAVTRWSLDHVVGQVPAALPELTLSVYEADRVAPGWTLTNLSKRFEENPPLAVVLVDERGRYRWYHQRATTDTGEDTDTRVVPEGVLIGGTRYVKAALVNWESALLWEAPFNMHHHIQPFGGDGQYLYLTESSQHCTAHGAGVVVHYDRVADETLWAWFLCQHWTPPVVEGDWSHTNTIEPYPDGKSFLLSARNQNQLYRVDIETEQVLWALGENGDFQLPAADVFLHQHAPELQPNGNILLYDNGLAGRREYSRMLELELNEATMTAKMVWEFRPSPDIFTPIWGDADRLENGNTLGTFGRRAIDEDSHLIEVTSAGEEVWHLVTPPAWGWYRAQRVVDPPLGYVIR